MKEDEIENPFEESGTSRKTDRQPGVWNIPNKIERVFWDPVAKETDVSFNCLKYNLWSLFSILIIPANLVTTPRQEPKSQPNSRRHKEIALIEPRDVVDSLLLLKSRRVTKKQNGVVGSTINYGADRKWWSTTVCSITVSWISKESQKRGAMLTWDRSRSETNLKVFKLLVSPKNQHEFDSSELNLICPSKVFGKGW